MISIIVSSTIAINSFTGVCYSKELKKISNKHLKSEYNNTYNTRTPATVHFLKTVFSNNKPHNSLSTKEYNWYFQPSNDNTPPDGPKETKQSYIDL